MKQILAFTCYIIMPALVHIQYVVFNLKWPGAFLHLLNSLADYPCCLLLEQYGWLQSEVPWGLIATAILRYHGLGTRHGLMHFWAHSAVQCINVAKHRKC